MRTDNLIHDLALAKHYEELKNWKEAIRYYKYAIIEAGGIVIETTRTLSDIVDIHMEVVKDEDAKLCDGCKSTVMLRERTGAEREAYYVKRITELEADLSVMSAELIKLGKFNISKGWGTAGEYSVDVTIKAIAELEAENARLKGLLENRAMTDRVMSEGPVAAGLHYQLDKARKEIARLKSEIREITMALNDDRTHNTLTIAQVVRDLKEELTKLKSDCAELSEEMGLPPTMRPAEGELKRILDQGKKAIAELAAARAEIERLKSGRLSTLQT